MAKSNCVLGARLSMTSDILKPLGDFTDDPDIPAAPTDPIGYWEYTQDPDSGAIERKWVGSIPDDPDTPDIDESLNNYQLVGVACEVKGVMSGGIRVAGTTQRMSDMFENIEWLQATFDVDTNITKTDKVTNIRNQRGVLIYRNEEARGPGMAGGSTVFDVMGVTPVTDPFGNIVAQSVLLQRSEVQTNGS